MTLAENRIAIDKKICDLIIKNIYKKYVNMFKCTEVVFTLDFNDIHISKYAIKKIYFSYYDNTFTKFVTINPNDVFVVQDGIVYSKTRYTQLNEYSTYKKCIDLFENDENRKKLFDYAEYLNKFIWTTTYIYCLPKAYTFLLANNKNKIFPKEIAKLIAYKMLFF